MTAAGVGIQWDIYRSIPQPVFFTWTPQQWTSPVDGAVLGGEVVPTLENTMSLMAYWQVQRYIVNTMIYETTRKHKQVVILSYLEWTIDPGKLRLQEKRSSGHFPKDIFYINRLGMACQPEIPTEHPTSCQIPTKV